MSAMYRFIKAAVLHLSVHFFYLISYYQDSSVFLHATELNSPLCEYTSQFIHLPFGFFPGSWYCGHEFLLGIHTYLGVESLGHRNVHVQFSEVMRQYQSVFHLIAFPRVSEMIVSSSCPPQFCFFKLHMSDLSKCLNLVLDLTPE